MPHLQRDPVHGRTIIVAEERAGRAFGEGLAPPQDLRTALGPLASDAPVASCPFCIGNEQETPPAVLTIPPDAATQALLPRAAWSARIFPNRYPAVTNSPSSSPSTSSLTSSSPFSGEPKATARVSTELAPARGQHEVLVGTARHATLGAQLSPAEWTQTFSMLQQRARAFRDAGWRWAALFQNVGAAAGASLAHLHAQLVALPEVPDVPQCELAASQAHHEQSGECLWCEMLGSELSAAALPNARVVRESEKFLIFCPAASRLPYEMCILPKCHNSHFEAAAQADLDDLGQLWRGLTEALEGIVPAYNWWIHSAPFDSASLTHYHWHIEVLPRSATLAGFEWSSGWHINTVCAEDAAETLRQNWPC
jgi:UDPglucose--hexose-1-phosphate uridylyltransferase